MRYVNLDRRILGLALPALATLIAEPLLILADTIIVGRLGTSELAGLTIATSVLGVVVGLSIFLAYGTTAEVARALGAGDRPGALQGGIDGMVLGAITGGVLGLAVWFLAPWLLGLYGAPESATAHAITYLRVVAFGLPAQLVILASTGVLRGLQDTRTPLYVVSVMAVLNVGMNIAFVFGLKMGIGGAALGTVIAMWLGGVALVAAVVRGAHSAAFRFRPRGIVQAARSGSWLVLRSAALHTALVATTAAAATYGEASLAAHQAVNAIWMTASYALDALAIAAQALVGLSLGAKNILQARTVLNRVLLWGIGFGGLLGVALVLTAGVLPAAFSPDPAVRAAMAATLPMLAVILPLGAIAFMYDGVLIGAGDARFLAGAVSLATAVYLPFTILAREAGSLPWLWAAYGVWLSARCVTLWWRVRTDDWARI